jgi:hypothetical protein
VEDRVWEGVEALLDDYVGLQAADRVLLLYTSDSQRSAALVSAALEQRAIRFDRVWMAPLNDPDFRDRLNAVLPEPGELAGRLVLLTFERDTFSHTLAITELFGRYDPARLLMFRSISASDALFAQALNASPEELSQRNASLLERFVGASHLRVRTRGGSDLDIAIESERYRWISNRGRARPGGVTILPAGEVATFPAAISGVHVADFAFNINMITERDARLDRAPVRLVIEDGRVVDFSCDSPDMLAFVEDCLVRKCASNVGELGFGTNWRIDQPIAMNSHINERRPGVHLGLGQHNQGPGAVGYQCPIHFDLIAAGGLVYVDDDPVPVDLENVIPSSAPHPSQTRDEDVFSPEALEISEEDCCGLLACAEESAGTVPQSTG